MDIKRELHVKAASFEGKTPTDPKVKYFVIKTGTSDANYDKILNLLVEVNNAGQTEVFPVTEDMRSSFHKFAKGRIR